MKVLDLIENNEWKDQPPDIIHQHRVQQARCREFISHLQHLAHRYPQLITSAMSNVIWEWSHFQSLSSLSSRELIRRRGIGSNITNLEDLFPSLKNKLDRVVQAKQKSEEADREDDRKRLK